MQKQITTFLDTFNIKLDDSTNSIIWAIKSRLETYWEVGLSRKEFERFGTTEFHLWKLIKQLRQKGLLIKTWMRKGSNNRLCNIYAVSEWFSSVLFSLWQGIQDMFVKLQEWSKNINPIEVLRSFWVIVKKNWKIRKGLTTNKKSWAMTNWKSGKTYWVFSYIQECFWLSSYQLAKEILIIN